VDVEEACAVGRLFAILRSLSARGEIEVVYDPDDDSLARETLAGTGTR
jgi:hypothetical protein